MNLTGIQALIKTNYNSVSKTSESKGSFQSITKSSNRKDEKKSPEPKTLRNSVVKIPPVNFATQPAVSLKLRSVKS